MPKMADLKPQFWAYLTPLAGAYIADTYLGRFKTIHIAIACALVGHVVLTASAAPSVIKHPNSAIGAFAVGMVIMGCGTGLFKSNISPLLAEQQTHHKKRVETLPSGERVIVDPAVTTARMFLWFYVCINIGSLVGQIAMVYAEKYVGFYLAFLLPTVLFVTCPVVLAVCRKNYKLTPPTGNVFAKFGKSKPQPTLHRIFGFVGHHSCCWWSFGSPEACIVHSWWPPWS
jgi:proton-dependent oligopeptide transporter, POT family